MTIFSAIREPRAACFEIRLRDGFWSVFKSRADLLDDCAIARDIDFVVAVQMAFAKLTTLAPSIA